MRLLTIAQLSSSTVTRTKANEAYRNLTQHLASHEPLVIDLRNSEALSFSFLDQLIWRLRESQALPQVTFLVGSESSYKNLAQVATSRDAAIYYQTHDHDSPKRIPLSTAVTRRI